MNNVILVGRFTKDHELKKSNDLCILKNCLAVARQKKDEADFINVTFFGKTAEFVNQYSGKGKQIAVQGRIQTGSYEKDGKKVYTTDVIADRVDIIEWAKKGEEIENFEEINEEIPF